MKLLFILFTLFASVANAQTKDEQAIRNILSHQSAEWNKGDLEGYMKGYWENDSLLFVGKNGANYGYARTLANYKKSYPDTTSMGKLGFDILKLQQLSADTYFVLGKWMLKRTIGDLNGYFTLLVKKINEEWVIVADHSS